MRDIYCNMAVVHAELGANTFAAPTAGFVWQSFLVWVLPLAVHRSVAACSACNRVFLL